MENALISISIILGMVFLFIGSLKLFTPNHKLEKLGVKGLDFMPSGLIKVLGTMEIIGSIIHYDLFIYNPSYGILTSMFDWLCHTNDFRHSSSY